MTADVKDKATGLEKGHADAVAEEYDYEGLSPEEIALREEERKLNAKLDQELASNPDKMPRAIWYIIPNEFGERFCYYGVYSMINSYYRFLGNDRATAKQLVSSWKAITYFFPLIGGAISDSYLGKYKTIVYLSVVYLLANIMLLVTSIPSLRSTLSVSIGLYLMAFGTGGIKPCVGPHGGDQFLKVQRSNMVKFWNLFYSAINVGGGISSLFVPMLRDKTSCFGDIEREQPVCYLAGFLPPVILFAIAFGVFVYGERYYRIVPPAGVVIPARIALVIGDSIGAFVSGKRPEEGKSFFTLGSARYGEEFALEVAEWWRVFYTIFPISFVWMVYDQQNTEWANQYDRMNQWYFGFNINPDWFTGVINPIMIVFLCWILPSYVYPAIERTGYKVTPLRRMVLGCFLVTASFVWSGIFQTIILNNFNGQVDDSGMQVSDRDTCTKCVSGLWQLPQWFVLSLGEALFSPTGNEFAYTQVSKTMKATMASFWLALVGFGNLYITALEGAIKTSAWTVTDSGDSSPAKFYFYSAISLFFNIVFVVLAYVYKYKKGSEY